MLERLTPRSFRDVAFRRKVREAYGYHCAISGLMLRNGGGRPEVQAAHIRPVENGGSDPLRNGLALSGTLHWMFDCGLISVADDYETILVSQNKVPKDVVTRLLARDGKLGVVDRREAMPIETLPALRPTRAPWNKGRIVGQKRPLLPKHVWSIRVRLEMADTKRDLALFNMAIDCKLRGCHQDDATDACEYGHVDLRQDRGLCDRPGVVQ